MFLFSRLAVTLAVLFIAAGLLFTNSTDVKSNIASSLLGALMGYWFSIDGTEGQAKHVQNNINEGGANNAAIQYADNAGERPTDSPASNEK